MLVTIFSDASHCPQTRVGGWGAWAKSGRGTVTAQGAFRMRLPNTDVAELYALTNALHMVVTSTIFEPGDSLLLQSDSLGALDILQGKRKTVPTPARLGVEKFQDLLRSSSAGEVEFRHVKGHSRDGAPRSWVNNLCDRLAKQSMRAARKWVRA